MALFACGVCGRLQGASWRLVYNLPDPRYTNHCGACGRTTQASAPVFFLSRILTFVVIGIVLILGRGVLLPEGGDPLGPVAFGAIFVGIVASFYLLHVAIASACYMLVALLRAGREAPRA
jgi:hypothetical protein